MFLVIAGNSGQGSVCRHVWEFSVISLVRQGSSYCHEPAVATAESDYGPPAVKGRALYARPGARHVSRRADSPACGCSCRARSDSRLRSSTKRSLTVQAAESDRQRFKL